MRDIDQPSGIDAAIGRAKAQTRVKPGVRGVPSRRVSRSNARVSKPLRANHGVPEIGQPGHGEKCGKVEH